MTTPAENAATVPDEKLRAQLIHGLNGHVVDADTAWAIIHRWDALLAQAEAAEGAVGAYAARLRESEAERDALLAKLDEKWAERDAAVRAAEQAQAALRQIADGDAFGSIHLQEIARAALTGEGTE